jgi:PPK2 family polyphosphate:nucleotide phosphotransferase
MYKAVDSPYCVPFEGQAGEFSWPTRPPADAPAKNENKKRLNTAVERLDDLQRILYAHNQHALLLVFQAMDAAGKDSTIRAVMRGVNPAGCQVFSFKQPSALELDHDFLWRTCRCLPERGRIGVFNRSYYEEVLVVRVHPEYLDAQRLPDAHPHEPLWQQRYQSIRDHEQHLARNGTVILKFWLNVSKREQKKRFLSRIDEPNKNWKFSESDVTERQLWDSYQEAYRDAVLATSRPWAPWYAIPADNKPFMRATVADIVVRSLEALEIDYPRLGDDAIARMNSLRKLLD